MNRRVVNVCQPKTCLTLVRTNVQHSIYVSHLVPESLVRPIDADLSYEEWLQTPPTLQDIKDANPFTKNETPPSSRSSFIVSGPPGVGE